MCTPQFARTTPKMWVGTKTRTYKKCFQNLVCKENQHLPQVLHAQLNKTIQLHLDSPNFLNLKQPQFYKQLVSDYCHGDQSHQR